MYVLYIVSFLYQSPSVGNPNYIKVQTASKYYRVISEYHNPQNKSVILSKHFLAQSAIELAISENGFLSKVDLDEIELISDSKAYFIENLVKTLVKVSDMSENHENDDQSLNESHENEQFLKIQSVQGCFGEFDNI